MGGPIWKFGRADSIHFLGERAQPPWSPPFPTLITPMLKILFTTIFYWLMTFAVCCHRESARVRITIFLLPALKATINNYVDLNP